MSLSEERSRAVSTAVDKIRNIFDDKQPDQKLLDAAKSHLLELAKLEHLFTLSDFPPPEEGSDRNSCLYRLAEDTDHRFALYANVANGAVNAPPHDHTTWAVIVGVLGQERNKFYSKTSEGVQVTNEKMVEKGSGVTLMPDDLHSIHIEEGAPVLNFHMYGLALEQLPGRNYWSAPKKTWKTFPPHTDIREARS